MSNAVMSKPVFYVDKVNGDGRLDSMPFDADRCRGDKAGAPLMSVSASFGYTIAAVMFASLWGVANAR